MASIEFDDSYHQTHRKSVGFKTDAEVHWDAIHNCPTLPISDLKGSKFMRLEVPNNHEPVTIREEMRDEDVEENEEPDGYFVIENGVVYRCETRKLHRNHPNCYSKY